MCSCISFSKCTKLDQRDLAIVSLATYIDCVLSLTVSPQSSVCSSAKELPWGVAEFSES